MTLKPLSDRIAVVTGASRGIGRASALALAKAGAHVVAIARTQGGLEELDDKIRSATGARATLVPLDLTDGEAIDQLGGVLHERFGKVDIIVHAAATLGVLTPVSHIDPKLWDRLVSTNLTATWRIIRSFEPLLRAAPSGRALFLTTGKAVYSRAFWGGYAATKSGMEALVRCWADEIEHTKVRVALIDPGRMRTRMRAEAYPGEDPATLTDPSQIGPLILELAQADLGLPVEVISFPTWKQGATVA